MKYVVIESFTDLTDDRYKYSVGDKFPRTGLKVSKERYDELSGNANKRGKPVIEGIVVERKKRS